MVVLVTELRLRLLAGSFTRSRGRAVLLGAGYLACLGAAGSVALALLVLGTAPVAVVGSMLVLTGAVMTVLWITVPLLLTGTDDTLAPRRFALLPVSAARLLPAIALAGTVGIGLLCSLLVTAGAVGAWSAQPRLLPAALVGGLLGLTAAYLAPKVLAAGLTTTLASRRYRDLAGVAMALSGVGATLLLQGLSVGLQQSLEQADDATVLRSFSSAMRVVGWTPLGWGWAVPWELAEGRTASAVVHAVLALGLVLGLLVAWWWLLRRALTSPLEAAGGSAITTSRRLNRLLGGGVTGTVAARLLRYYRRDPRRLLAYLTLAALPVLVATTALLGRPDGQLPVSLLTVAPLLGLVLGPTVAFDLSYDGSALWTHLAAGVRGWQDRLGRVLALAVLTVPLLLVVLGLSVAVLGMRHLIPLLAGSLATLLCSLGTGSWVGALIQVEVPPPGSSPFAKGSGGGAVSVLVAGLTIMGTAVLSLPALVVAVLAYSRLWAWYAAVPLGLAVGLLTLVGGVLAGGRLLDRRWPEVLSRVTRPHGCA